MHNPHDDRLASLLIHFVVSHLLLLAIPFAVEEAEENIPIINGIELHPITLILIYRHTARMQPTEGPQKGSRNEQGV